MKFDPESWALERGQWGNLDAILIAPRATPPRRLVTLCHGFGAPGTDLVSLVEKLIPNLSDSIAPPAFLFPQGPIDLEEEYGMGGARAWWLINMARLADMTATEDYEALRNEVPPGIDEARGALEDCIVACIEHHSWNDCELILGGFSQGAMLTVDTAMRSRRVRPRGLILWSGALICANHWTESWSENGSNKGGNTASAAPVVYQSHGRQDTILPIATGRALHRFLEALPLEVTYEEFNGPHTIPEIGLQGAARLIESLS